MLFAGLGIEALYLIIALLVAIDVHECCHAWMANRLGDPTAKEAGRLSLNPLAHLDPWGTLMLLLVGLGWGKPVPINAFKLRYGPKRGMAMVGIAGPLANIITATILALPLRFHLVPFISRRVGGVYISFGMLLSWVIWLNLALAVFNMIPFAPLDGSRILAALLPSRWFFALARYERYGLMLLLLLIAMERFARTGILEIILLPPIKFLWWQLVDMTPPFSWLR